MDAATWPGGFQQGPIHGHAIAPQLGHLIPLALGDPHRHDLAGILIRPDAVLPIWRHGTPPTAIQLTAPESRQVLRSGRVGRARGTPVVPASPHVPPGRCGPHRPGPVTASEACASRKVCSACRIGRQGFLGPGRQWHQLGCVGGGLTGFGHKLPHDQMHIRAAVAEGAQGRHQGLPIHGMPGGGFSGDVERRTLKFDQWIERLKM